MLRSICIGLSIAVLSSLLAAVPAAGQVIPGSNIIPGGPVPTYGLSQIVPDQGLLYNSRPYWYVPGGRLYDLPPYYYFRNYEHEYWPNSAYPGVYYGYPYWYYRYYLVPQGPPRFGVR